MIGKVSLGQSFYGAVRYVALKKDAEILCGDGIRIDSVSRMANDFEAIRNLKPGLGKAVWHASISFAHGDRVNNEEMIAIGKDYLTLLGLTDHQYLFVRHNDRKHAHMHLVINRVSFAGLVASDAWCKNRTAKACDLLEQKYSLTVAKQVRSKHESAKEKTRPVLAKKEYVKSAILTAISAGKVESFDELKSRLVEKKIEAQLHVQKTGRVNGVSFRYDGLSFKGSALGSEFKLKGILRLLPNGQKPSIKTENTEARLEPAATQVLRLPITELLKQMISGAIQKHNVKNFSELKTCLKEQEIDLVITAKNKGRSFELKFISRGVVLSSKILGQEYSYKALQSKFLLNGLKDFPVLTERFSQKSHAREGQHIDPIKELSEKLPIDPKEFLETLRRKKWEVLPTFSKKGSVNGFFFRHEDILIKGSCVEKKLCKSVVGILKERPFQVRSQDILNGESNTSLREGSAHIDTIENVVPAQNSTRQLPSHEELHFVWIGSIRKKIEEALKTEPGNFSMLKETLSKNGVELVLSLDKSGKPGTVYFISNGIAAKGTDISHMLSPQLLQKVFLQNELTLFELAKKEKVSKTLMPSQKEIHLLQNELSAHVKKCVDDVLLNKTVKDFNSFRGALSQFHIEAMIKVNGASKEVVFIHRGLQLSGLRLNPPVTPNSLLKLFAANKVLMDRDLVKNNLAPVQRSDKKPVKKNNLKMKF